MIRTREQPDGSLHVYRVEDDRVEVNPNIHPLAEAHGWQQRYERGEFERLLGTVTPRRVVGAARPFYLASRPSLDAGPPPPHYPDGMEYKVTVSGAFVGGRHPTANAAVEALVRGDK